ncbi:DUF6286 domain-containing Asp23/Gls24 family envelope stress response protein [Streptomyces sp. LaPpAH-108]|uniref:DUF6286 domain-containing Asp23/Gls24 family envelope stress response protein n=1 Tax=Streptomyces sp. LaPpAH-108 TaxID=1155714 RepID=UPI00036B002A|nr:DUF6286 domain-containing Asp23/Gls24 family envelope stress response protein [Streptomyces sp. LaPpAH-108]
MTEPHPRGTAAVSEQAVRRIAGRAATEAHPDGAVRITGSAATVHGRRTEVALDLAVPYPEPLAPLVRRIQDRVTARTAELTGLDVSRLRIGVTTLTPASGQLAPAPPDPAPASADTPRTGSRAPRRWWSQRRFPLGILALLATLAFGSLAADLILVHTGHRPAAAWRTGTLHWLYGHGPGEPLVTAVGTCCALLGAVLLVLAVTPGRRNLLTTASPASGTDIALDRSAVAALLRDAATGTDGVTGARTRVRRRRATVRADLASGDRTTAELRITQAADNALAECGLRRPLRLRVTARPRRGWAPAPAPVLACAPPPSVALAAGPVPASGSAPAPVPASAPVPAAAPALAPTPAPAPVPAAAPAPASAPTSGPAAPPPPTPAPSAPLPTPPTRALAGGDL